MKDKLNLLKLGVKNVEFPIYMKHIESKDGYLTTYNKRNLVRVPHILPFDGLVNFFTFDSVVGKIDYPNFVVKDDILIISSGSFKVEMPIVSSEEFIETESVLKKVESVETITITEELFTIINRSLDIIDGRVDVLFEHIYIDNNSIIATSGSKLLYYTSNLNVKEPFGIDRNIVKFLSVGCELGAIGGNSVVKHDNSLIISSSYNMDTFPVDKIIEGISNFHSVSDKKYVCNSETLKQMVQNVRSISIGEEIFYVNIKAEGGNLTVSCVSATNGKAEDVYDEVGDDVGFDVVFKGTQLYNIPDGFHLYFIDESRFYFVDTVFKCIIIVMAEQKGE